MYVCIKQPRCTAATIHPMSQVYMLDISKRLSSVEQFIRICIHSTKRLLLAPEMLHTLQDLYRQEQAIIASYTEDIISSGEHAANTKYCDALLVLFRENNWFHYNALSRTSKAQLGVYLGLLKQMELFFFGSGRQRDYRMTNQHEYYRVRAHVKMLFKWTSALDDLCLILCRVSDGALVA